MKAILTKADVVRAMGALKSTGRKVTISALHAELDRRGSLTTLCRLKAEIDCDGGEATPSDSALEIFREVWAQAVQVGRDEAKSQVAQLEQMVAALSADNERLDAQAIEDGKKLEQIQSRWAASASALELTQARLEKKEVALDKLREQCAVLASRGDVRRVALLGADGRAL